MYRFVAVVALAAALLTCTSDASAFGGRRHGRGGGGEASAPAVDFKAPVPSDSVDALDFLNSIRVKAGLHPFKRSVVLTDAARRLAFHRASRGISGHCNDFSFIAPGSGCSAAGCGVTGANGWATCFSHSSYTVAGAASCMRGGSKYCDLFVMHEPGSGGGGDSGSSGGGGRGRRGRRG